jgi:ATP-dependent Clp protease adaptor protein ClpS
MPKIEEELEFSVELEEPNMYRVILHNDDYTTMDFVVEVLMSIFHKSSTEAVNITMDIHEKGRGVCGVYVYEIAQAKVAQVMALAKENEYPLLASIEEDK